MRRMMYGMRRSGSDVPRPILNSVIQQHPEDGVCTVWDATCPLYGQVAVKRTAEEYHRVVEALVLRELRGVPGFAQEHYAYTDPADGAACSVQRRYAQDMLECVAGRRPRAGLPVRVVRGVAEVLCAGLTHLHDSVGVAHLDVKPDNVLLVSGPGDPTDVVLCDFGAAHHLATKGGRTADVVGTPRYMAPELHDCRFSAASDAYSLGMTLFSLLTAWRPPGEADPAGLEARMRAVCASDADRRFVRDVARLTAARPCDRAPHASLGEHF